MTNSDFEFTCYSETAHLSQLIQERDIVLNNLEVAEVQYINSFQLSTPFPSITDYEAPTSPQMGPSDLKRHISRPKALRGSIVGLNLVMLLRYNQY